MRSALLVFKALLFLITAAGLASQARAGSIPNTQACVVPQGPGGMPVVAEERVGPSAFVAHASWGSNQWPSITYSSQYFALPPVMQAFLSLHECGHLVLKTTNEFFANCYAVANGHWTAAELATIQRSHEAVGEAGPQYGGSGAAFWAGTKQTCPQYFTDR